MEPQEVVQAFFDTLNRSGPEAAAAYMADNFVMEQPGAPPVQSSKAWLAGQAMWRASFPDIKYTFELHGVEGNHVRGRSQGTGTHTRDLDLSPLGKGVVAATGKVVTASQVNDFVVEGGKIVSNTAKPDVGGGIPGLLAQLGIEMS